MTACFAICNLQSVIQHIAKDAVTIWCLYTEAIDWNTWLVLHWRSLHIMWW